MKWIDFLPCDVYRRLCECRNNKHDLPILVSARWKWIVETNRHIDRGYTKEDALVYVLEMLDSNSQCRLADITEEEYNELILN